MSGYVKFTGDYSKLKKMGFTFQRLYASNYMQWENHGIRVWKRGGDVTLDNFDLYDVLRFIRREKPLIVKDLLWLYHEERDGQKYFHPQSIGRDLACECMLGEYPNLVSSDYIHRKTLDVLTDLNALGWYELVDNPDES